MEFQKDVMLRKYAGLRQKYVEPYEPDLSTEGCTVRYAKIPDMCLSSDLCSHRIMLHVEAKKALFPRLYGRLPKGAEPSAYAEMYFDKDDKLHHLVHRVGEAEYVTIPVSEQLCMDYRVVHTEVRPLVTFLSMEWTEYGSNGEPISVETFQTNGRSVMLISCEYYRYENDRMTHADVFKDFAPGGKAGGSLVMQMAPDRITNPDVFAYDLQRTDSGVLCRKTTYWSASRTFTGSFTVPEKELVKMEEHGIRCFL